MNCVGERLQSQHSDLKHIAVSLDAVIPRYFRVHREELIEKRHKLARAAKEHVQNQLQYCEMSMQRMRYGLERVFQQAKQRISSLYEKIVLLDPHRVLRRGYSITSYNGKVVKSIDDIALGGTIHTALYDGTVHSNVTKKEGSHGKKSSKI